MSSYNAKLSQEVIKRARELRAQGLTLRAIPATSESAPPPQAHASTLELPPEIAEVRELMEPNQKRRGWLGDALGTLATLSGSMQT